MLNVSRSNPIKRHRKIRIKDKVKFYGAIATFIYFLLAAYVILNITDFTILYK